MGRQGSIPVLAVTICTVIKRRVLAVPVSNRSRTLIRQDTINREVLWGPPSWLGVVMMISQRPILQCKGTVPWTTLRGLTTPRIWRLVSFKIGPIIPVQYQSSPKFQSETNDLSLDTILTNASFRSTLNCPKTPNNVKIFPKPMLTSINPKYTKPQIFVTDRRPARGPTSHGGHGYRQGGRHSSSRQRG